LTWGKACPCRLCSIWLVYVPFVIINNDKNNSNNGLMHQTKAYLKLGIRCISCTKWEKVTELVWNGSKISTISSN
jgi:hypothetical protein